MRNFFERRGDILNKMFSNKKLSIPLPWALAAVVYILFVLFGTSEEKMHLMIATPLVSAFLFFGLFLIIFVQVKNPYCPKWYLNFAELFFTAIPGICSGVGVLSFFISSFQNYSPAFVLGFITYSSVSWVHSTRKDV